MAGLRVQLIVVVLTGIVLLVSVRAWEPIDGAQLLDFYESGRWAEPQGVTVTSSDDDDYDLNPDDAGFQVEGSDDDDDDDDDDSVDLFAPHGFEVNEESSGEPNLASGLGGGFHVEFVDAPPRSWADSTSQSSTDLDVDCSDVSFQITLPTASLSNVKVLGSKDVQSVMDAPSYCGYEVNPFKNTLTIPFTGCHVTLVANCSTNTYNLQLLFPDEFGQSKVVTASCKVARGPFPRTSDLSAKCITPTAPPSLAQNCAVTMGERVTCGYPGISSSDCEKMGCCVDSSACYYPLDECTGDQHFVFAVRDSSASIPVDPTKLVIPGSPNCKPVIVNNKVAIFKFKVTECGVRSYEVGETKIYLAEIQTVVEALNLKYGVITRCNPLRLMVECRYSKFGSAQQSLASVGYMVKTPTSILPSSVLSDGLYGVQLRLAKDKTYSSYFSTDNLPLQLLLGTPVYIELRLLSPKPYAVILVNYCIAYPRSARNALVLVYEGCANPNDPNVSILQVSDLPKNRNQRRFVVKAFQFMEQKTNKYLNEEIYFMCSSEVCMPAEKTCEERCFDGKTP